MSIRILALLSLILVIQQGCATVGPLSIVNGRSDYNVAIQETSRSQTLLNFVRVANHDTTLFMDVTEVDAAMQFSGNLSANALFPQAKSASGLGSTAVTSGGTSSGQTVMTTNVPLFTGHDFSLTAGTTYQEAPTIRYAPLIGQPLVAQLSSPITPDSIATMFDSDWPIRSILTLASDRLTPNYTDYYQALDLIGRLDDYGALVIVATRSKAPDKPAPTPTTYNLFTRATSTAVADNPNSSAASSSGGSDTLSLYFNPKGANSSADPGLVQKYLNSLWGQLCGLYYQNGTLPTQVPNRLDLRFSPATDTKELAAATSAPSDNSPAQLVQMPAIRTRSALGVLRASTHQDWGIAVIISKEDYNRIQPLVELMSHPKLVSDLHLTETIQSSTDSWFSTHPGEPEPTPQDAWNDELNAFKRIVTEINTTPPEKRTPTQMDQAAAIKQLHELGKALLAKDYIAYDSFGEKEAAAMLQIDFLQHAGQYRSGEDSYANDFYVFNNADLASDEARRARPVAPAPTERLKSYDRQSSSSVFFAAVATQLRATNLNKTAKRVPLFPTVDSDTANDQTQRHFVVLICQNTPPWPWEAFVSVSYLGRYYYIASDDEISKKNLAMIGYFLTIQAVASPNAPLTPTISVGSK